MVFVTTTVRNWIPIFSEARYAVPVLDQFAESLDRNQVSICGYVLMPSHLHALLGVPRIEQLSEVMKAVKTLTSRQMKVLVDEDLRRSFSRNGEFVFWKRRFDDLVVWSEKQFAIKLEYIHNNPVKAGLVARAEDYPYSSARDWLLGEDGKILIDKAWSWQGGSSR